MKSNKIKSINTQYPSAVNNKIVEAKEYNLLWQDVKDLWDALINGSIGISSGKYPVQTVDLDAGIETLIATTLTTFPYSIELFDNEGNIITGTVTIRIILEEGVYNIYVYSTDALSGVTIYIQY